VFATEVYSFFLEREDGTVLEGYFSPTSTSESPIVLAIQGSSCESMLGWHTSLSAQVSVLGLGLIVLEKQGVSREGIDLFLYNQTNCLEKRLQDYMTCLENVRLICPDWKGKPIFWGESEGGILAAILGDQITETAAILLFGIGGGMEPREEVKWSLRHRLQKHGALQEEIDAYMSFLDEQMDAMILEPNPEKQFLGNTHKCSVTCGSPTVDVSIQGNLYSLEIDLGSSFPFSLSEEILQNINKTDYGTAEWSDFKGQKYQSPAYTIPEVKIDNLTFTNQIF